MDIPLHPHDDYPYHQGMMPLHIPATSDPHYQDGYYFSFFRPDRHVFMGLRLHPNNNVMDAYAGVVDSGEQRDVRMTRTLLPRHGDLEVGPLRLDIVEPMVSQRLVLGDNPTGLTFDVTFTNPLPPSVEHIPAQYRFGRLFNQVLRYSQSTRATGALVLDGVEEEVDNWFGCRDHSWGIRSTFGPHIPLRGITPEDSPLDPRAIRVWVPFDVGDHTGFWHGHAARDGSTLDFEGEIHFPDRTVHLVEARHDLRYHPGTRRFSGGHVVLVDRDGDTHEYEFELACDGSHPQGYGYTRGWADGGQHGVHRGDVFQEHDRFRVDDPTAILGPEHVPPQRRLGPTEFVSTVTHVASGATGMTHFEHMVYGDHQPGPGVLRSLG